MNDTSEEELEEEVSNPDSESSLSEYCNSLVKRQFGNVNNLYGNILYYGYRGIYAYYFFFLKANPQILRALSMTTVIWIQISTLFWRMS